MHIRLQHLAVGPARWGHEFIKKIRARITMCLGLARSTTDAEAAKVLQQIADEGEEDVNRCSRRTAGRPVSECAFSANIDSDTTRFACAVQGLHPVEGLPQS
jgi:hypothetical protein